MEIAKLRAQSRLFLLGHEVAPPYLNKILSDVQAFFAQSAAMAEQIRDLKAAKSLVISNKDDLDLHVRSEINELRAKNVAKDTEIVRLKSYFQFLNADEWATRPIPICLEIIDEMAKRTMEIVQDGVRYDLWEDIRPLRLDVEESDVSCSSGESR